VLAGGQEIIFAGARSSATTISSGGKLTVSRGGVAIGSIVSGGGMETVISGGTISNTKLAGGSLSIASGGVAAGLITFTGTGGSVVVSSLVMPTAIISGFAAGDHVNLAALTYSKTYTAAVKTAGVVTISAGAKTYALHVAGAKLGETNFTLGSGSGGGTLLGISGTLGATAKMDFLAPSGGRATTPHEIFASTSPMAFHRGAMQTTAPHTASAHFAGAVPDLLITPRGGSEMLASMHGHVGV
jgi:autotransporter passenger strand-loop-strand repeat protein